MPRARAGSLGIGGGKAGMLDRRSSGMDGGAGGGGLPPQMQGLGAAPPMKNLMQVWDEMKSWPDEKLMQELQNPSGLAPVAIIAAAQEERNSERERYQNSVAQQPETTVYDDLLAQAQGMGGPQGMEGGAMSPAMDPGMGMGPGLGMDPGMGMDPGLAGAMPSDMMPPGVPGAPIEMGMPSGPPMMQAANGAYPVRGYYEGGELSRHRESEEERILRLEAENPSPSYLDAVRDEERLRSLADVEPSVKSDERRIRELLEEAEYWKQNKDFIEEGRGRGMRGYLEGGQVYANPASIRQRLLEEERIRRLLEAQRGVVSEFPTSIRQQRQDSGILQLIEERKILAERDRQRREFEDMEVQAGGPFDFDLNNGLAASMATVPIDEIARDRINKLEDLSSTASMRYDSQPRSFLDSRVPSSRSNQNNLEDMSSSVAMKYGSPAFSTGRRSGSVGSSRPLQGYTKDQWDQMSPDERNQARGSLTAGASFRNLLLGTPGLGPPDARSGWVSPTSDIQYDDETPPTATVSPPVAGNVMAAGTVIDTGTDTDTDTGTGATPDIDMDRMLTTIRRPQQTFEQYMAQVDEAIGGPEDTAYIDGLRGRLGTLEKRAQNTWSGPALMQVAASFLSNAPGAGGFGSRLGAGMGAAAPMIQSGMEKDREIEARALRDAIALERVQANERTATRRDRASLLRGYEVDRRTVSEGDLDRKSRERNYGKQLKVEKLKQRGRLNEAEQEIVTGRMESLMTGFAEGDPLQDVLNNAMDEYRKVMVDEGGFFSSASTEGEKRAAQDKLDLVRKAVMEQITKDARMQLGLSTERQSSQEPLKIRK